MRRTVRVTAVCAVALHATVASAGIPERLKWVRGTVAAATSDSVTIALRAKTLLVPIDEATEVMVVTSRGVARETTAVPATTYLRAGDAVEVHYRDSRHTRLARYLWVGIPLDAKSISKRPSTSAAGSVADIKAGSWLLSPRVTLTSGKDHRRFHVRSDTMLMDARGAVARAKTRLPPAADALERDDRVVVVYRQHKSTLNARLIRILVAAE